MKLDFNRSVLYRIVAYSSLGYFIYLMWLISLQYVPIDYEAAFLNIKQAEIKWFYYKITFFSHVYSSILIISLGVTQFSSSLRKRFSIIHKLSGKAYVLLTLLIASPSGLIMAYHANGGLVAQISFAILSVLWFLVTLKAYTAVRKGAFQAHQNFMIRSYALALSAISLRLFKYIIVSVFELPPMDTYKIVSILGWVVNLAIAEIIILQLCKKEAKK